MLTIAGLAIAASEPANRSSGLLTPEQSKRRPQQSPSSMPKQAKEQGSKNTLI